LVRDLDGHTTPVLIPKGKEPSMTNPLFAATRKFTGVPELSDDLMKHQAEIAGVLKPIKGFRAYYLIKTADGILSVTLCEDRAGVEESNRVASTWLKEKLPTYANRTPEITVGEVRFVLEAEAVKIHA
jgi:hypothetical protein